MGQEKLYIEKELSWLAFNERVLQEAADKSNPLIERMRFLGIYSNNLDEFYKVRFAELKRRIIISEEQGLNSHSRHLLGKIHRDHHQPANAPGLHFLNQFHRSPRCYNLSLLY